MPPDSPAKAAGQPRTIVYIDGFNFFCQFYKQVPRNLLAQTQLPDVVHDSTGPIRKPDCW